MAHPPYKVEPYSLESFCRLLVESSECDDENLSRKLHVEYFREYFGRVRIATVVVEFEYVDHDYLVDFSAYYVRCFHPYRRFCTRVHFFASSFSQEEFDNFLRGDPSLAATLAKFYRGFVVVRPLPQCIVGRTCLGLYDDDNRRFYQAVRDFESHPFGLNLGIETLPFQEQDQVTAACATSALWSAFQQTGHIFHHPTPTPVEITRAATAGLPHKNRELPNIDGLTIDQMAQAIRFVGLEPLHISPDNPFTLRANAFAYLKCRIPVVLVVELTGRPPGGVTSRSIGYHAVTVTGYCLNRDLTDRPGRPKLVSDQIGKLYAHDDQVGPHARMEFGGGLRGFHLTTSWGLRDGYERVKAHPFALLVPLYHKIRIPLDLVYEQTMAIDGIIYALKLCSDSKGRPTRLTWEIQLITVSEFKQEMRNLPAGDARRNVLAKPLPRYIWWASGTLQGSPVLDVAFDATDIASGKYLGLVVSRNAEISRLLLTPREVTRKSKTAIAEALTSFVSRAPDINEVVVTL